MFELFLILWFIALTVIGCRYARALGCLLDRAVVCLERKYGIKGNNRERKNYEDNKHENEYSKNQNRSKKEY